MGSSWDDADVEHGFLWEDGVMTELRIPSNNSNFFPYSINNRGQMVGYTDNSLDLILWTPARSRH